jgi:hypothetical protein
MRTRRAVYVYVYKVYNKLRRTLYIIITWPAAAAPPERSFLEKRVYRRITIIGI